jgi:hypothetical protein
MMHLVHDTNHLAPFLVALAIVALVYRTNKRISARIMQTPSQMRRKRVVALIRKKQALMNTNQDSDTNHSKKIRPPVNRTFSKADGNAPRTGLEGIHHYFGPNKPSYDTEYVYESPSGKRGYNYDFGPPPRRPSAKGPKQPIAKKNRFEPQVREIIKARRSHRYTYY